MARKFLPGSWLSWVFGLAAGLIPAVVIAALPSEKLAEFTAVAGEVSFQPNIEYSAVRVTLSGPDGFEVVQSFGSGEAPAVALPGADGLYKYELRFTPVLEPGRAAWLQRARAAGADLPPVTADYRDTVQSGWFRLAQGFLVESDLVEKPADTSAMIAGPVSNLVLSNADGVIRNSLCVGFDCPNEPIFDDSTILLMENNTRIKFGDTSNAPFPNNDWEIEANSNLSGGLNYLGFNDCGNADNDGGCAADLVFAVESGARASALYVEDDGDVGIGTSLPVLDFHIVTGNTPALRLDQDGSSGFAPQVWDVAGNEANFFIRDVTGGSKLPLRIRPGAPTSAVDIAANGNIGIGATSPKSPLHIRRSDRTAKLEIEDVSATAGILNTLKTTNNGNTTWQIISTQLPSGANFLINWSNTVNRMNFTNTANANSYAFEFTSGDFEIDGDIITNSCPTGCGPDYVFDPDYELMPLAELERFVLDNRHLPNVASSADNAKGVRMLELQFTLLEKIEELTLYTIDQQKRIESLEARNRDLVADLSERDTGLEREVADLRALVQELAAAR